VIASSELKITLEDERTNKKAEFRFTGGIAEFVKQLNRGQQTLHDSSIYMEGRREVFIAGVDSAVNVFSSHASASPRSARANVRVFMRISLPVAPRFAHS
jgi:DNA gyrase/topoisomerase IV subunit B